MLQDLLDQLPQVLVEALEALDDPITMAELAREYLESDESTKKDIIAFFSNPVIRDRVEQMEEEKWK